MAMRNLDISLFRSKPPEEYLPIGSALSFRRKQEAETGQQHKIACFLGFLFGDLVPDTPKLISAYGKRASDIMSQPDINPCGTEKDGPFKDYVGADGTSVWTAATATPASISVHLLACMLARSWSASQATAIWVELIEERRRKIQGRREAGQLVNLLTELASLQDYPRDDLAMLDACARSWLQKADESMKVEQTQLNLALDNIELPPVSKAAATYDSVMPAWFGSMELFEKLLNNEQREAYDHTIWFAISSWHMYPDLLIFQPWTRKISFNDTLFPTSAILSIGIEDDEETDSDEAPSDRATGWSLALSHLNCNDDPVHVGSSSTQRITIDELWLVCLGSILRGWQVSITDLAVSIQWFAELGRVLQSDSLRDVPFFSRLVEICRVAANSLSPCHPPEQDQNKAAIVFIKYGWRRSLAMFGDSASVPSPPFFGLCNPHLFSSLEEQPSWEIGFNYLRNMARSCNIPTRNAIMVGTRPTDIGQWCEWVTLEPISSKHPGIEQNSIFESSLRPGKLVARWLFVEKEPDMTSRTPVTYEMAGFRYQRCKAGEYCEILTDPEMFPRKTMQAYRKSHRIVAAQHHYFWPERAPPFFAAMGPEAHFIPVYHIPNERGMSYQLLVHETYIDEVKGFQSKLAQESKAVRVGLGLQWLKLKKNMANTVPYLLHYADREEDMLAPRRKRSFSEYDSEDPFSHTTTGGDINNSRGLNAITGKRYSIPQYNRVPQQWLKMIRAIELITAIYRQMPTATIPLRATQYDISCAAWLPNCVSRTWKDPRKPIKDDLDAQWFVHKSSKYLLGLLTRPRMFACIAMLESGDLSVNQDSTMRVVALCSQNSIFVTNLLLSDPTVSISRTSMRHLVGNIGHPGVVLIATHPDSFVRRASNVHSFVNYQLFDGRRTDAFEGASLHLSFTSWKTPLFSSQQNGEIDQQLFLLESVVSVQDKGKWVANIDVLCLEQIVPRHRELACDCKDHSTWEIPRTITWRDTVSLDSWDEIIDPPSESTSAVVRANGNWVARLAVASLLIRQGRNRDMILVRNSSTTGGVCLKNMLEGAPNKFGGHFKIPYRFIID